MYHTFQAGTATGSGEADGGKASRPAGSRRISTSNACVECRRRKIRCDGVQPCGQCQWYQHPELCHYAKPTQRVVPSKKLVEKLQSQVDQYQSVFARLFPGQSIEEFLSMPREELVNLAITLPSPSGSSDNQGSSLHGALSSEHHRSDGAESLEALEQAPEQDPDGDEVKRLRDNIQAISDDVNGLSLAVDRASSYVGISSVNAAMKVIFKTSPIVKPYILRIGTGTAEPSRSSTPPPFVRNADPNVVPPSQLGELLIDSYFAHVHCLMPMIDEQQFRNTYLYSSRRDSPWLALLNMVFALGSLSSSTCDNEEHMVFYQRARKHFEFETYGSGSLYIVQALGLFGGYYLHWLNRPNEANGIMGACLRMATAHGLHREYSETARAPGGTVIASGSEVPAETRRRTWWSLYCLDSWASITTGRPSLGRTGTVITVESPRIPQEMSNAQYLESLKLLPLIHFIGFCKIATRAQDLLATHTMLASDDLFLLDAELEKWYDELPPILKDILPQPDTRGRSRSASHGAQYFAPTLCPRAPTSSASNENPFEFPCAPERRRVACPEMLRTPRAIMYWRYQNLRMLIHRPFLLTTALRRTPYALMSLEEKRAVSRCRVIAGDTVRDIDATCQENLIAGWNAVWMMYQAVMVPLVSLFSVLTTASGPETADSPHSQSNEGTPERGSDDDIDNWRWEVEKSIAFFDRMQRWSVAAKKSKNVVQRLYDASKYVALHQRQLRQQQWQQQQYHTERHEMPPNPPPYVQQTQAPSFGTNVMLDSGIDIRDMAYSAPDAPPEYSFVPCPTTHDWNMELSSEAAVNDFWNEMMWDQFPPSDTHDSNMLPEELGQENWWPSPMMVQHHGMGTQW